MLTGIKNCSLNPPPLPGESSASGSLHVPDLACQERESSEEEQREEPNSTHRRELPPSSGLEGERGRDGERERGGGGRLKRGKEEGITSSE